MTNIKPFQRHDDIMEEARAWVLKFNSDQAPTAADISQMREWASRSPAHRAALKEAEDFWCEAELLAQLAVPLHKKAGGGLGRWINSLVSTVTSLSQAPALAAPLVLLVSLGLGVFWWSGDGTVGNGTYATAIGEQKSLTLKDHSVLMLDTDSQVRIDYQDTVRHIHLLQGKAHFEVAKNPQRPFEVYAREGLVRAVGTAFSVYLASSEIEVIVDEGRVDLARVKERPADLPVQVASAEPNKVFHSLDRGQSARFNKLKQVFAELDDKTLAQELAWRKGVLVFARDPLGQVVAEVSRYTDTQIDIADPDLSALVMGGRFRVGELEALFEVLEIGFGVKVRYINKNHVQLYFAANE